MNEGNPTPITSRDETNGKRTAACAHEINVPIKGTAHKPLLQTHTELKEKGNRHVSNYLVVSNSTSPRLKCIKMQIISGILLKNRQKKRREELQGGTIGGEGRQVTVVCVCVCECESGFNTSVNTQEHRRGSVVRSCRWGRQAVAVVYGGGACFGGMLMLSSYGGNSTVVSLAVT